MCFHARSIPFDIHAKMNTTDVFSQFLKGRSTDDANFLMLRLQDLSRKWQSVTLYFLFLDWVKCYDRIHLAPLLDALRRFGLPDHYLKIP